MILNPYLELWRESQDLPPELRLRLRKKLIWAYSWAIPDEAAARALAELSPLIEIGAGSGYWAWIARQAGADIAPFDRNASAPPHWLEVREGGPEQLELMPERNLLLCWPPLGEPMAAECLSRFRGERVLYVGEWRGRTGDAGLHDRLEREFARETELEIPRWPGFEDRLYVLRRR